ncbi:MAG: hypothetical protein ACSLE6_12320 [Mycobacterium sp.]
MQYGDPPNGPYGGHYPQYGEQYPQQGGGQYPQQGGGQYPQQGGQYPAYGGGYQQPTPPPSYGAQPYQQPGQYGQYGQPPSGGGNKVPIIAAIVVAVLVLSGVGVWLVIRPDGDSTDKPSASDSSSSRTTTSRTRTSSSRTTTTRTTTRTTTPSPTSAGDPAAESRLISALPNGYSSSNCRSADPAGALARLVCDASTITDGPTAAVFTIFADQPSLDRAFNASDPIAMTEQLRDCPDGSTSPGTWTYSSDPDVTAGYVACGFSADNTPQVTWSKYRDLTMGYVVGNNLDTLHDWWWEYG